MRFTVDTTQKTIVLHSSFKFEDFKAFQNTLPTEWLDYIVSVENWTPSNGTTWHYYGTPSTFTTTGQYKMNFDN